MGYISNQVAVSDGVPQTITFPRGATARGYRISWSAATWTAGDRIAITATRLDGSTYELGDAWADSLLYVDVRAPLASLTMTLTPGAGSATEAYFYVQELAELRENTTVRTVRRLLTADQGDTINVSLPEDCVAMDSEHVYSAVGDWDNDGITLSEVDYAGVSHPLGVVTGNITLARREGSAMVLTIVVDAAFASSDGVLVISIHQVPV